MNNKVKPNLTISFKNHSKKFRLPKYDYERKYESIDVPRNAKTVTVCFKKKSAVCSECEGGKKRRNLMSSNEVKVRVEIVFYRVYAIKLEYLWFFESRPGCITFEIPDNVEHLSVSYGIEKHKSEPEATHGHWLESF